MQKIQDMPGTGAVGGSTGNQKLDTHHAQDARKPLENPSARLDDVQNTGSLLSRIHAEAPQYRRSLFRR
jgi:hypothetical protein